MLRPEIPTLPPPAYLLDETEGEHAADRHTADRHTEDWHSEDWHTDERPSAA